MTAIIEFEKITVGKDYPAVFHIEQAASSGFISAEFHKFTTEPERLRRAELREKAGEYGLFVFKYEDTELPEWWKDSKIVWELPHD